MYSDKELGWLVGIVEGEGCLSMTRKKSRKNRFAISFNISNSDIILIQKCKEIIDQIIGRECAIIRHSVAKLYYKPVYRVWLYTFEDMKKFLEVIIPMMFSDKKLQAEIMLRFVTRRLLLNSVKSHFPKSPEYTKEDFKYLEAMKSAKNIIKSVETIRSLSPRDNDIVRAATISKIAELCRNDITSICKN